MNTPGNMIFHANSPETRWWSRLGHALHMCARVPGVDNGDGDGQKKPGPDPDRLKIDMPYEEALRKALKKKKPAEGWPKHKDSDDDEGS